MIVLDDQVHLFHRLEMIVLDDQSSFQRLEMSASQRTPMIVRQGRSQGKGMASCFLNRTTIANYLAVPLRNVVMSTMRIATGKHCSELPG